MKLAQKFIDSIISKMYPPTGIWRDFQHDSDYYQALLYLIQAGKLELSDLPPVPNPADYADIESPKTRP